MPKCTAALATRTPMAPRPMIPSFFPLISQPANFFFCFSAFFAISSEASCCSSHSIPPTISLEARSIPAMTISFTPLAFAPGVLKTTTPFLARSSRGILFTPAPALATATVLSESSRLCISALLTRIASACARSSVFSYFPGNFPSPTGEMGFKQ